MEPSEQIATPLSVLYRDRELIAINKPAGLLVHRSHIDRHETRFALQLLRDQIGQHVYPVHRLDKPTSGVLLFALDSHSARAVSEQFVQQLVSKRYIAVVRGFPPVAGEIDHPLKVIRDKIGDRQSRLDKAAQSAQTRYQTLAHIELPNAVDRYPRARYALLLAEPKTGRKHQIRRHCKHIAHPIIGDPKYGKSVHNRFIAEQFQCPRLLLHCAQLQLAHPISGERLTIQAALDGDFARLVQQWGWDEQIAALFARQINLG